MAAYVIAEVEVTNAEGYEAYRTQVPATLEQYGGTYVVRGGAIDSLEGESAGRMVILQFEDVVAAKRWYNSPEYQAIVGTRHANSTGRLTLVEGV
jgi:uncharacterized protein (DUF1330 family)